VEVVVVVAEEAKELEVVGDTEGDKSKPDSDKIN